MFAIVRSGGKQYRVSAGDEICVERLPGQAGQKCVFDEVLMIGHGDQVDIGDPVIGGAKVRGEIVGELRGPKITIYKKRQRSTYRRKIGHRQTLTSVRVVNIQPPVEARTAKPSEDTEA